PPLPACPTRRSSDLPLLMGTDAPQQFSVPGFSLHRELEVMEAAGLTPYEVLRTGTVNVGRYFEESAIENGDTFGSVAEGHRADLDRKSTRLNSSHVT